MTYLTDLATQIGVSMWLLAVILVWTAVWKLLGLWKAARNGHIAWFVIIALLNTVGILPILYIYVLYKWMKKTQKRPVKKKKKKK